MEEIYAACVTYEPSISEYVDFGQLNEPVWILGRLYNSIEGENFEKLQNDIRSKLWFTYRKHFSPIGDTYYTSDSGWGCMHRCGQMLLAQALIFKYLGRDWIWLPEDINSIYFKILNYFNDTKESRYSIHRIAEQGCILSKQIGHWFGPNTIVQVLKKLMEDDQENNLVIHVAMDNMVIKNEIRKLFKAQNVDNSLNAGSPDSSSNLHANSSSLSNNTNIFEKAILLTIPLRLGLSEITPVYFDKLKASFTLKQSLGIIGGRTNHASYFIGYVGNQLIYLDPHTTQLYESNMDDKTYHCNFPSRMNFSQLDPSIALCFYCENEADFEDWCINAQRLLLEPVKDAIFEILEDKPPLLPYLDIDDPDDAVFNLSLSGNERIYTSDDEFELLV